MFKSTGGFRNEYISNFIAPFQNCGLIFEVSCYKVGKLEVSKEDLE